MLRKFFVSCALLLAAAHSQASSDFAACTQNFYKGFIPKPVANHEVRSICFDSFAVLYSGTSKTAVYAAQYLTPASLSVARGQERTNRFYEEGRLPRAFRSTLADYAGSGYDRGHLAAAAEMPNQDAMAQSFSLANMVPQNSVLNRGVWAKNVERATRNYVMRSNGAYVITGPIYDGTVTTIGPSAVWVPTQLFKLVYDPEKRRAWAYILPNTAEAKVSGVVTYADLVTRLGFELLPPDSVGMQ